MPEYNFGIKVLYTRFVRCIGREIERDIRKYCLCQECLYIYFYVITRERKARIYISIEFLYKHFVLRNEKKYWEKGQNILSVLIIYVHILKSHSEREKSTNILWVLRSPIFDFYVLIGDGGTETMGEARNYLLR